jgi:hypothetical protein
MTLLRRLLPVSCASVLVSGILTLCLGLQDKDWVNALKSRTVEHYHKDGKGDTNVLYLICFGSRHCMAATISIIIKKLKIIFIVLKSN